MTYEEALAYIGGILNSDIRFDESLEYGLTSYDFDWLELAKEALEKQMPKKVMPELKKIMTEEQQGIIRYPKCPNCSRTINAEHISDYCTYCGQALDWSDIK